MPQVRIEYIGTNGEEKTFSVQDDTTELRLISRDIKQIDLSPLSQLCNLLGLFLGNNRIEDIDLLSVVNCDKLVELDLSRNQLGSIDLTPLSECPYLQKIGLAGNKIKTIDLSPLSRCQFLENVDLSGNNISEIDLSPLSCSTENLNVLFLEENPIKEIDVTPLLSCDSLYDVKTPKGCQITTYWIPRIAPFWLNVLPTVERMTVDQETDIRQLKSTVKSLEKNLVPCKKVEFRANILSKMKLDNFQFLDTDLTPILSELSHTLKPIDFVSEVGKLVICSFREQIHQSGTTMGVEISELTENRLLLEEIDTILELRRREMESLCVLENEDIIDLRPIWLTVYGFRILKALGMKLETDILGFRQVRDEIRRIGYELNKTADLSMIRPLHISDEMKSYILSLVNL